MSPFFCDWHSSHHLFHSVFIVISCHLHGHLGTRSFCAWGWSSWWSWPSPLLSRVWIARQGWKSPCWMLDEGENMCFPNNYFLYFFKNQTLQTPGLFVSLACVPGVQMMKATAKHPQWLKKKRSTRDDPPSHSQESNTTRFGGPKVIDPNLFEPPQKKSWKEPRCRLSRARSLVAKQIRTVSSNWQELVLV